MGGPFGEPNKGIQGGRWSGLIALLPYIEQGALYDRFMSENVYMTSWATREFPDTEGGANNPRAAQPTAFICPSNGASGKPANSTGYTNYRFCMGDNPGWSNASKLRGAFSYRVYHELGAIKDGMSNTLAFSEKAVDDYGANTTGVKVQAATYASAASGGFTADGLTDRRICLGSATRGEYQWDNGATNGFSYKFGWHWAGSHWYHVGFVTTLPPNSPSCYNRAANYQALFSATSFHTGGVNVALLDGSCTFVSDTIDSGTEYAFPDPENPSGASPFGIWGAYGSRGGGESVSL